MTNNTGLKVGVNWGITRRHYLGEVQPQRGRWSTPYDAYEPLCGGALTVYDISVDDIPHHIGIHRAEFGFDGTAWCKRCAKRGGV